MNTRTLLAILAAVAFFGSSAFAEDHEFKYKSADAKTVELMGEWNGWKSIPMTKDNDNVWTAKVTLSPGTYGYKFLIDGKDWVFDPDNSNKKTIENIENSAVEIK